MVLTGIRVFAFLDLSSPSSLLYLFRDKMAQLLATSILLSAMSSSIALRHLVHLRHHTPDTSATHIFYDINRHCHYSVRS